MNVESILLWGAVATVVLTAILTASLALGWSRMSVPFLLGTMLTPNRNLAPLLGFLLHLVAGWTFAVVYALAFESWGRATWWLGAGIGAVHALALLIVFLPILPGIHPRMASENQGPEPTRALEPPGFLGLHYGRQTPLLTIVAHLVYGAILGAFYQLVP